MCIFRKGTKKIISSYHENPDNEEKGTKGGNATLDKVFLLSVPEAKKYLSLDNGLGYSTEYAISQGAVAVDMYTEAPYSDEEIMQNVLEIAKLSWEDEDAYVYVVKSKNAFWCLRTPGWKQDTVAIISNRELSRAFSDVSELINLSGSQVDNEMMGIRPAIWYEP